MLFNLLLKFNYKGLRNLFLHFLLTYIVYKVLKIATYVHRQKLIFAYLLLINFF
jgi:hypothetical protein